MKTCFLIALRNLRADKKKSLMMWLAIFLSMMILILSDFTMNGVSQQVIKSYVNLQAGEVAVMWKDLADYSSMSSAKFLGVNATYHLEEEDENKQAIEVVNDFLAKHAKQIKYSFETIRRNTSMVYETGDSQQKGTYLLYSLSEENASFLTDTKTIEMEEGSLVLASDTNACISHEMAEKNGISLNSTITLLANGDLGDVVTKEFTITGIYADGAGYNNNYIFVTTDAAQSLYQVKDGYFDILRIYTRNSDDIELLTEELDGQLKEKSDVLRAETYYDASKFYTSTYDNIKLFFTVFTFFLLFLIGFGLYSILKVKIYERLKEFGTLRAIGYRRFQCVLILFNEVFILAILAFIIAALLGVLYVAVFGHTGIYVGSGGVSFVIGGESFYPIFSVRDILKSFLYVLVFSILSTLGPSMRMCYQNISDLLSRRQKPVSLIKAILKR